MSETKDTTSSADSSAIPEPITPKEGRGIHLTERAGKNQVRTPKIALLQSVGGAASTVLTNIFGT